MSDILEKIVAVKREEIANAQRRISLVAMRADCWGLCDLCDH